MTVLRKHLFSMGFLFFFSKCWVVLNIFVRFIAQLDELERIRRQQQTELEELVSSKDATGELSDC